MAYGKKRYNAYRKRSYAYSKGKAKEYATKIDEIYKAFDTLDRWSISSHLDSAYCHYSDYTIRLSNHSADNSYHDLMDGKLIVNIKCSKLDFLSIIDEKVPSVVEFIDSIDLSKYRFINVVNNRVNCFVKGYKTKKDVFELNS